MFSFDFICTFPAQGGALRSLTEMGAMLTMFTTAVKPGLNPQDSSSGSNGHGVKGKSGSSKKEDNLVMDTKLKIIDILQFILDVRLDYRITCLLSIFKKEFAESKKDQRLVATLQKKNKDDKNNFFSLRNKEVRGIDLDSIGAQAEGIFGSR